jgi:hypothetical protein
MPCLVCITPIRNHSRPKQQRQQHQGGGTPHKPPIIGRNGHVLHESTACADYLIQRGAAPGALLKEVSSYDTVGCA